MYLYYILLLSAMIVCCKASALDMIELQLESNCNATGSFMCRNGKCIEASKHCNDQPDCTDSSDEEDCDLTLCREPNYFRCKNNRCIFANFRCDAEDDCGDLSDESHCYTFKAPHSSPVSCSSEEWECLDHLCIPKQFVCNGERDCLDGSDETLGCTQGIHCDTFKCKNGHCIPNEWICDGTNDCGDSSDELNCQTHVKPKDCHLENKLFLCHDNVTCVNLTNVCDNVKNCPDKSDEGDHCNSANSCALLKCKHDCIQLPTGAKCVCNVGYETLDNGDCKDIDECEIYGICDQKCRNSIGSYECYCDQKYVLNDDEKTCRVVGGEALMVYSSKTEIRGFYLQSQILFPIAKNLKQVLGVSFDGHHIYWTDIYTEHESIARCLEDGSEKELVITSGLGAPEDLALDWITGNIYFTDSELRHIGVCTNDGVHCTVLVNENIHKPRALVLHPSKGDMYWTDWGKKPVIGKSKMDGFGVVDFISDNIRWPNGLAIDSPNERLYWTDAKLMKLESIRLDGTDRRVILEEIVEHPYAIAVFENRLFWSDWVTHSVQSCNKFTGKEHEIVVKEKKEYIYGLHIYHSALNPQHKNPCANSVCSHICLINGPKGYTCACPQNSMLATDQRTCKEVTKRQMLIVAVEDMIIQIEHQILGKHNIMAIPSPTKNITALTYSPANNTIYLADADLKKIISFSLDMQVYIDVASQNIGIISSLDYDYLGNNLYWSDIEKETIEVLSLTTGARKILIRDLGGEKPMSLALVPEEGVMFIASKNVIKNSVHIDRLWMDGTSRTHSIEAGLVGPITLHYDLDLHSIFWADAGAGRIESTSVDGDTRHNFKLLKTAPISITSLKKELFWTNHDSRRIYWAPKDNIATGIKKITLDLDENMGNMHLVSINKYRVQSHPCRVNNGNCSHLCLLSEKAIHCGCPLGMTLSKDNVTCEKGAYCDTNQFHCPSSDICIEKKLRCNGLKDCLMGEDEEDCIYHNECEHEDYYQCRNGECIERHLVCDLHFDCADKSDELDCLDQVTKRCPAQFFKCFSNMCVHERFVCDGIFDCSEGEDENNCRSATCGSTDFRCDSGLCIPKNWECDRDYDCPDLSDEHVGCLLRTCSSNQFTCSNGLCIDSIFTCNGLDDCGDQSDEHHCETITEDSCNSPHYQCTSDTSICLPASARCNGTSECPHHEDEQGCHHCHVDEYQCKNEKCIPQYWICDNADDCGDNSDETICTDDPHKIDEKSTIVACESGFRCKNGACIDMHLVCNGDENCYDGSDENGACNSSCTSSRNPCNQICKATPTGPTCLCNTGYELLGDGYTCRDIKECSKDPPVCSQYCIEKVGGYNCSCYSDFLLRSDRTSCKSTGAAMSIFFSTGNEIRQYSQSESSLNVIVQDDTPSITGLDATVLPNNFIYFCIEELGSIYRLNLKTKYREYITKAGKPQKLVVDWITENFYYIDNNVKDKSIKMCNFNQKQCTKILDIDINSQVSSFTVDFANKYIFYSLTSWWLMNVPHTVVYKVNLDGTKQHEIMKNAIGYITGMAYDFNQKLLYYVDQHNLTINRMNYDGREKEVIINNITKPFGLDFFEDHLYYLTHYGYLGKCRLFGNKRECQHIRLSAHNTDMFVISQSSKQPISRNVCSNHSCDHLCIPSDVGPRCVCGNGKIVAEGETCQMDSKKGPQFGTKDANNSGTAAWILFPIFVVLIFGALYYIYRRRSNMGRMNVSMRFQNPVYGLPTDAAEGPILVPGQHEYYNPINLQSKD